MSESQLFRFQAIDDKGIVSGALAHFRQGRAPGVIYTDKAMRIPARNPLKANSRGILVAYLPAGEEFEVTVTRADGSFFEQFDSTSVTGVTERIIEREVPVEKVVYRDHPAAAMLDELETVKTKLDDRPADPLDTPLEPPEEISALLREGKSLGDAADELARRMAVFNNKRIMNLPLTEIEAAQEARLQKVMNWFQGDHAIEVI